MYTEWIYYSFVQLRKQLYKLKTQIQLDKYSQIEYNKRSYKTFRKFYDECEEYLTKKYLDRETEETIQEIFERCLNYSHMRILKKSII